MMMKIQKYMKWMKILSFIVSGLVTLWILVIFWTWLGPATFWQKVAGFLLSAAGGVVLFLFFQFLIMMTMGIMIARHVQGKLSKRFEMMQEEAMEDSEEEEEEEESMYE